MMKFNKKRDYCTCVPDSLYGVSMKLACYYHDLHYGNLVKNRKTRKQADVQFRRHIKKAFFRKANISRWYLKPFYWIFAYTVSWRRYLGVRLFAGGNWVE